MADRPPLLALPTDRPRPEVRSFRGDALMELQPPKLYAELRNLSRRSGMSLFVITLATFDVLMARSSGQRSIVLASGVANRRLRETEEMLGMVVNTIHSFANLVQWHLRCHGPEAGDAAAQVAGPGFDASVWEICPVLAAGGTLCITGPDLRTDAAALVRWLEEQRIVTAFLPTPLAEAALLEPWPAGSALGTLLTGGDRLHAAALKTLPVTLYNQYGPTENAVVATWQRMESWSGGWWIPDPPIGRPIDNVEIYLLDERLHPLPIGIAGELCIAGRSLARGYSGRADLTAQRFVPDPFSEQLGGRLYKTGDQVRTLASGEVNFLGRLDHHVKVRGFRVELGEIEVVLRHDPEVREAAVVTCADGRGTTHLVARDDDFFHLGGHSLLATQAVSRLEQTFEVQLPLRVLFEARTVAGVAEVLADTARCIRRPPLVPQKAASELPLSFAQQRLWFLDRLAPDSPFYNVPIAWTLHGPLHETTLFGALGEILRRHQVLRSRFPTRRGRAYQVIDPWRPPATATVDLRHLEPSRRRGTARHLATAAATRPFDLGVGPLIRITLVRLESQESVLLLTLHHMVADGWSMGVLLRELAALYGALCTGRPVDLPTLPVQYVDFALWQQAWLRGDVLEEQLSWWTRLLMDAEVLELPTDHPRSAMSTFRGRRLDVLIPSHRVEALEGAGRRVGATLAMTLLAAVDLLLLRWTHQDLPFEQLVEHLHPERDLSKNPIFQVMSTLQNAPMPTMQVANLRLEPLPFDIHTTHFDLEINFWHHREGLRATLVFGIGPRLKSSGDFLRQVSELNLKILDLPTAYWHELMADPGFDLPTTVRLVILGGEKARAGALEIWHQRMRPDLRLLNTYGPSEATIVATACDLAGPHAVPPMVPTAGGSQDPPIGRPLPGCRVVLVDRLLHPVERQDRPPGSAAGRLADHCSEDPYHRPPWRTGKPVGEDLGGGSRGRTAGRGGWLLRPGR